jgi:hypothetical protein
MIAWLYGPIAAGAIGVLTRERVTVGVVRRMKQAKTGDVIGNGMR